MDSLKLIIDGKAVKARKGATLLQAARSNGIVIPTHCHDESLHPYGACRLCLVEIAKGNRTRIVAACVYEAEDGLTVRTRTPQINAIRKMIIELTWPFFSEYAEEYGAQEGRFSHPNDDCSLCGKCVRFCEESGLADIVYFKGRGTERTLELIPNRDYEYEVYKKCMSFCSCGRLKSKVVNLWNE